MRRFFCLATLFFCLANLAQAQTSYTYKQPELLADGWQTASFNTIAQDTLRAHNLFTKLHQGGHKVNSVLLVKDGNLVLEEYFNGRDVNQTQDLRSATKSIRSLLLGIAIDRGFISSIDDPISKYLKNLRPQKNLDPRKETITIRHLITMSAGWDCNDWDKSSKGQEDRVYKKRDWLQYTVDLPLINNPGEVSTYCSMGVVLVAQIISEAANMPIDQFAQQYLFDPLGIQNVSWGHTSNKEVIAAAKRLYMTPRDFAKIGLLTLNKGKWGDQQLVPESWITQATAPQTQITGMDYGYLWWNIPLNHNNNTYQVKTATGNGGQYIMIIEQLNMVAIFTGAAYNSQEDKLAFAILKNVFMPAFIPNAP